MRTSLTLSSDVWLLICTLLTPRSKLSVRQKIKQDSSSAVLFFRKKTTFENKMYSPSNPPMLSMVHLKKAKPGTVWNKEAFYVPSRNP